LQNEKFQLGDATSITAVSEGEPGNRYFYLLIEAVGGEARLRLEKEQLFQLALAVQRLLSSVSPEQSSEKFDLEKIEGGPKLDLEFVIEKLILGQKNRGNSFFLNASELVANDAELRNTMENSTVEVELSRAQLELFSHQALEVCAAGRPLCPLCGAPMGREQHLCPRTNGHVKL
jgi:uncharacterized repeat protein (TIGR03847 family)